MEKNGKIMLTAEDGSEEAFFVVEKAEIAGREYLLVTDRPEEEEGEEEALILRVKETGETDDMLCYEVVEDEQELTILSKYFEELLEDVDIMM